EARLLLSEFIKTKKPLTELSDEISKRIHYFTDQLLLHLDGITLTDNPKDPLIQCFLHYCPATLVEKFRERLLSEIPEDHKKATINTLQYTQSGHRDKNGRAPIRNED